jgi:protein TonB
MAASSWDRESSYRKRIVAILPGVLLLMAILVFVTRHMGPDEIFRRVGLRGELQLMPEITIVPDVPSPDASPAPRPERAEETVALDLREVGDFDVNPPRVESRTEEQEAHAFDDADRVPSVHSPDQREVSYSNAYVIVRMLKPKYPPEELKAGIEGNVTVALLVDERGRVADASVVSSMGPAAFRTSALEAAREFLFQPPTTEDGRPTTMWVKFLIKFRIFG